MEPGRSVGAHPIVKLVTFRAQCWAPQPLITTLVLTPGTGHALFAGCMHVCVHARRWRQIFEEVYVRKYPAVAYLEGSAAVPASAGSAAAWFEQVRTRQRQLWDEHPDEAPAGYSSKSELRMRLML